MPLSCISLARQDENIPFPSPLITVPTTNTYRHFPFLYPFGTGEKNSLSVETSLTDANKSFSFVIDSPICHSREGGNPLDTQRSWIPAFAGMTVRYQF